MVYSLYGKNKTIFYTFLNYIEQYKFWLYYLNAKKKYKNNININSVDKYKKIKSVNETLLICIYFLKYMLT